MSEREKWWKKLDPFRGLKKDLEEEADEKMYTEFMDRIDGWTEAALKLPDPGAYLIEELVRMPGAGPAAREHGIISGHQLGLYRGYVKLAIAAEERMPRDPSGKRLKVLHEFADAIQKRLDTKGD